MAPGTPALRQGRGRATQAPNGGGGKLPQVTERGTDAGEGHGHAPCHNGAAPHPQAVDGFTRRSGAAVAAPPSAETPMSLDNPIVRYVEGARLAPLPAQALRTALRALAHSGEAADPLVFVGRERELDRIIYRAEPLLAGSLTPRCSLLFQGAPGSGKSVLMREAARRLERMGVAALVKTDVPDGAGIETLYRALADRIAGTTPDDHRVTRTTTGAVRGGVPGVIAGEVVEERTLPPRAAHSAEAIRALAGGRGWGPAPAAAVFIDEIQNAPHRETGSPASWLLRDLHTQNDIPVLMVLSGLADSDIALDRAGLSRIDKVWVRRLSVTEARECLRESAMRAVRAGVGCGDRDALDVWADAAAAVSDGWPRHVQNELLALWEALCAQEAPSLDAVDFGAVRREGDARRERYYADRIRVSGLPAAALRPLCEAFAAKGVLERGEVVTLADEGVARLAPSARREADERCPPGMVRFDTLLHAGVVTLDDEGRCVSPIPSMVASILARA